MTKEELSLRFMREMADVRVSPQLKNATLQRAEQREEPVMKRKLSVALVCAMLMLCITAVALAAAARLGMLDFAGNTQGVYVPEDAQDYVQADVLHMENALVAVDVREMYYDGLVVRMTVDVKPRSGKVMLLGEDLSMDDPWSYMTPLEIVVDKTYTQTIRDVYREGGYESAYSVSSALVTGGDDYLFGSGNYSRNEDGTFTIYMQQQYTKDMPQRDATFRLSLFPFEDDLESVNIDGRVDLEQVITLSEAVYGVQTYQSAQPVEFSHAGVRVDKLTLQVRAQEIYAIIDYTVLDENIAFEYVPCFEIVHPDPTQQLMKGLMAYDSMAAVGTGADGLNHYRQTVTLGRNELHAAYTLRAYAPFTRETLETQTIPVELIK